VAGTYTPGYQPDTSKTVPGVLLRPCARRVSGDAAALRDGFQVPRRLEARAVIKPFFSALRFLTPAPVPASWAGGERELARSLCYFPVVGVLAGGVIAAVCFGLDQVLPPLASSALVVGALIAISRGLHMDGLADTADGLLSSRPREQALAIMRDSRTGPMGVVAVVCVLLVKTALFAAVAPAGVRWRIALLMPLAGRYALVLTMTVFRYARPEGGLATVFTAGGARNADGARASDGARGVDGARASGGTRVSDGACNTDGARNADGAYSGHPGRRWLLAAWSLLVLLVAAWLLAGLEGLVAGGASVATGLLVGLYCRHRIGGYTGDTLGATSELVECVPALVGALWAWN